MVRLVIQGERWRDYMRKGRDWRRCRLNRLESEGLFFFSIHVGFNLSSVCVCVCVCAAECSVIWGKAITCRKSPLEGIVMCKGM